MTFSSLWLSQLKFHVVFAEKANEERVLCYIMASICMFKYLKFLVLLKYEYCLI